MKKISLQSIFQQNLEATINAQEKININEAIDEALDKGFDEEGNWLGNKFTLLTNNQTESDELITKHILKHLKESKHENAPKILQTMKEGGAQNAEDVYYRDNQSFMTAFSVGKVFPILKEISLYEPKIKITFPFPHDEITVSDEFKESLNYFRDNHDAEFTFFPQFADVFGIEDKEQLQEVYASTVEKASSNNSNLTEVETKLVYNFRLSLERSLVVANLFNDEKTASEIENILNNTGNDFEVFKSALEEGAITINSEGEYGSPYNTLGPYLGDDEATRDAKSVSSFPIKRNEGYFNFEESIGIYYIGMREADSSFIAEPLGPLAEQKKRAMDEIEKIEKEAPNIDKTREGKVFDPERFAEYERERKQERRDNAKKAFAEKQKEKEGETEKPPPARPAENAEEEEPEKLSDYTESPTEHEKESKYEAAKRKGLGLNPTEAAALKERYLINHQDEREASHSLGDTIASLALLNGKDLYTPSGIVGTGLIVVGDGVAIAIEKVIDEVRDMLDSPNSLSKADKRKIEQLTKTSLIDDTSFDAEGRIYFDTEKIIITDIELGSDKDYEGKEGKHKREIESKLKHTINGFSKAMSDALDDQYWMTELKEKIEEGGVELNDEQKEEYLAKIDALLKLTNDQKTGFKENYEEIFDRQKIVYDRPPRKTYGATVIQMASPQTNKETGEELSAEVIARAQITGSIKADLVDLWDKTEAVVRRATLYNPARTEYTYMINSGSSREREGTATYSPNPPFISLKEHEFDDMPLINDLAYDLLLDNLPEDLKSHVKSTNGELDLPSLNNLSVDELLSLKNSLYEAFKENDIRDRYPRKKLKPDDKNYQELLDIYIDKYPEFVPQMIEKLNNREKPVPDILRQNYENRDTGHLDKSDHLRNEGGYHTFENLPVEGIVYKGEEKDGTTVTPNIYEDNREAEETKVIT